MKLIAAYGNPQLTAVCRCHPYEYLSYLRDKEKKEGKGHRIAFENVMKKKLLSFVIPCYGSEKTIAHVVGEIQDVVSQRPEYAYEIVAVNDCSPDGVWDVLLKLAQEDSCVKPVRLAINMNRPGAVMAGITVSSGDYITIMDDDGQCPMDRFWDLLDPVLGEYDVATADYPERKQSLFKDFGTLVNKKMTQYILDRPKDLQFTNFMVIRRYIADEILKYKNPYPYMTGLLLRTTNRIACVPMEERERYSGNTTFTFLKLISLWMNGLTAFSVKPLRLADALGVVTSAVGGIYGIYLVIRKLSGANITMGYTSLMAAILFVGGIIMLLLGMLGEYVGRIYICMNNSPQFVIRDMVNFDRKDSQENS